MRPSDFFEYFALRRHLAAPWSFLRGRKRPGGGPVQEVPLRGGGTLRVRTDTMDRHILHRILGRDAYHLDPFRPGELGCVIDAGAHIGIFAIRAASLASQVLAFEPDPENFELLLRNTGRIPNIQAIRKALGPGCAPAQLSRALEPSARSTVSNRAQDSKPLSVECIGLEAILNGRGQERCGLLKLDCEGAEHGILRETPRGILARIDRIAMEYHPIAGEPEATGEGLARILVAAGHRILLAPRVRTPGTGHILSWRAGSRWSAARASP